MYEEYFTAVVHELEQHHSTGVCSIRLSVRSTLINRLVSSWKHRPTIGSVSRGNRQLTCKCLEEIPLWLNTDITEQTIKWCLLAVRAEHFMKTNARSRWQNHANIAEYTAWPNSQKTGQTSWLADHSHHHGYWGKHEKRPFVFSVKRNTDEGKSCSLKPSPTDGR